MAAAAVAICVLIIAVAARDPAESADPALKPNQPNQSIPAPKSTSGILCGRIGSRLNPSRFPKTIASARAAAPELISTTVPPAKSRALSLSMIHPPEPPCVAKAQCATGI